MSTSPAFIDRLYSAVLYELKLRYSSKPMSNDPREHAEEMADKSFADILNEFETKAREQKETRAPRAKLVARAGLVRLRRFSAPSSAYPATSS